LTDSSSGIETGKKRSARSRLRPEKAVIELAPVCVPTFLFFGNFGALPSWGRLRNPLWSLAQWALVLLVVILLYHLRQHLFFMAKTWWLPAGASAAAASIDHHFTVTYILMGTVFVGPRRFSLGYFVWKLSRRRFFQEGYIFPRQHDPGNCLDGAHHGPLVGMNLASSSIWASERFRPAGENAVHVEVTSMQFAWYFRYPGADGKFGLT